MYTIAARPLPIRSNRAKATKQIGDELAVMRAQGIMPNIVMVQEAFRLSVRHLITQSDFLNWVLGPKT